MRNKVAMSTIRGLSVIESIDIVVKSNCCGIEIQTDYLPEDEKEIDKIFKYANDKGLIVSIHAPSGDINISALNKGIRKESINQIKIAIDLASKYNTRVVTFHPGSLSSKRECEEAKWEVLLESVAEIAEYAKVNKVHVGIENMERRSKEMVFTIDDLNRFAQIGVDNEYFGVTLDFSHFATNEIFLPTLDKLKLPIKNIHMSQCVDGKPHYPMDNLEGQVKLNEVLKELEKANYESVIVMELKGKLGWEIFAASQQILSKDLK